MFSIRNSSFRLLVLLASLAGPAALAQAAEAVGPDLRLEYALRTWTGARALGRTIGSVTMEFSNETLDGRAARVLRVRANARFLGIRLDALSESFMSPDLRRELAFHYVRTDGPHTESKLAFGSTQVDYLKLVDGEWQTLCRHPSNPPVSDMFAAVYLAPGEGMAVGGPTRTTRCAADLKLWDVGFRAVARERVTVPAGSFDAVRVEFTPSPANASATAAEFRGPYGLGPDMKLWLDPDQRILVKLEGTAHMALTLQVTMTLLRITKAP